MSGGPAEETTTPARDGKLRWWDLVIAFGGGFLAGLVLAALLAAPIVMRAMWATGHSWTADQIAAYVPTDFWVNHVLLIGSNLALLGFIYLVARRRFERPLARFFAPASLRLIAGAVVFGIALSLLLNGGNELLSRYLGLKLESTDVERALVPHGAAQIAMSFAVVALFAPFVEEYFFRGLLFTWARARWGVAVSALVSGALFGLAHGQFVFHAGLQALLYTVELSAAGFVLALWVARTGTLRTSYAVHAAYNAAAVLFSVLLP